MITANQFFAYEDQLTQEELSVVCELLAAADSQTQAMKYICFLFLGGTLEAGFRTKAMDAIATVPRRLLEPRAVQELSEDAEQPKGSFYRVKED